MTIRPRCTVLVALCVLAGLLTSCASTSIGRAVQAADVQKQLVQRGAIELAKVHQLSKGVTPPAAEYDKAKKTYADWVLAEKALAESLAAWKLVKTPGNEQKLKVDLKALRPLAEAYLALIGRYVDLTILEDQIRGGR